MRDLYQNATQEDLDSLEWRMRSVSCAILPGPMFKLVAWCIAYAPHHDSFSECLTELAEMTRCSRGAVAGTIAYFTRIGFMARHDSVSGGVSFSFDFKAVEALPWDR